MSVSTNRPERNATRKPSRLAGAGLALVPLGVFVVFAALLFPRAAPPDELPLPRIDRARIDAIRAEEAERVAQAKQTGLGPDARTLGSEIRAYHTLQIRKVPRAELDEAKVRVERARAFTVAREGLPALAALFAVQQQRFLAALEQWEREGARAEGTPEDPEHAKERNELGGVYLERLREAGWAGDHHLLANDDERHVLYKMMWGSDVGLDGEAMFALSTDERRVLYGLFLRAPHPPEMLQASLRAAVERAKTREDCELAELEQKRATARWRVGKIVALAEIDPDYPKHYALGIAQLEVGDAAAAAEAFRAGLASSPDGPYALRSRNLLKYAMAQLDR